MQYDEYWKKIYLNTINKVLINDFLIYGRPYYSDILILIN